MQLCRLLQRGLFITVIVQLSSSVCYAAYSDVTTLSACDYPADDWYIIDTTQTQFPVGYLGCADAAASNVETCSVCSCRERKTAPTPSDGVTVAWVVCVQAQDALTCVNNGGEYCASGSTSNIDDIASSVSSSRSSPPGDFSIHTQDSDAGSSQTPSSSNTSNIDAGTTSGQDSNATSTPAPSTTDPSINSEPTTAQVENLTLTPSSQVATTPPAEPTSPAPQNLTLAPQAGGNLTLTPTGSSSKVMENATIAPTGSSSSGAEGSSAASSSAAEETLTFPPFASSSQAKNEDNVISDVVGTVKPSTSTTAPAVENIIRPSANNSADKLDTNSGTSSTSSWSSERITLVGMIMCGIAVVAAIAVFVAVRQDNAKKTPRTPGTPADDFTDDDSALATPMTDRVNGSRGVYHHNKRDNGCAGGKRLIDASDNAQLASIVVISPGDDFRPISSSRQPSQSYTGARRVSSKRASAGLTRIASSANIDGRNTNGQGSFVIARQQRVSRGPWLSVVGSSSSDLGFDTMDTKMSFSSNPSSSEFGRSSSNELNDSGRSISFSEPETEPDRYSSSRGPSTFRSGITEPTSNVIVSLESSLSSLNNSEYASRDTEASEHIHESEDCIMFTNSSSEAMSFDVGSASPEF